MLKNLIIGRSVSRNDGVFRNMFKKYRIEALRNFQTSSSMGNQTSSIVGSSRSLKRGRGVSNSMLSRNIFNNSTIGSSRNLKCCSLQRFSTQSGGGVSSSMIRNLALMAVPGILGIGAYKYMTDDFELRSRSVCRRALNEHLKDILGEGTRLSGFVKKEEGSKDDIGLCFWIEGPDGRAHITVRGRQSMEYLCVRPHEPGNDLDMLVLVDVPPPVVPVKPKKQKKMTNSTSSPPRQQQELKTPTPTTTTTASDDPSTYTKETVLKTMGIGLVIGVFAGWLYVNRFRRTPMQSLSGSQNHLRTAHNLILQSPKVTRVLGTGIKTSTSSEMKMTESQLQASFALDCQGSKGEGSAVVAAIRTSPEDDWLYHIRMNFPGRTKKVYVKFHVEDGSSEPKDN